MKPERIHRCRKTDLAIRWPTGELWILWDNERPRDFGKFLKPAFNKELKRRVRSGEIPVGPYGSPRDEDAPATYRPRGGEEALDPRPERLPIPDVATAPLPVDERVRSDTPTGVKATPISFESVVKPDLHAILRHAIERGVDAGCRAAEAVDARSQEYTREAITKAVLDAITQVLPFERSTS